MTDEHASMAASTLAARSQRSLAVSTAFADRLRASNRPAETCRRRIRASHWDLPPDEKDDRALKEALDLLRGTITDAAFPPNAKAGVPN
jgi:hypothetical protein